MIQVMSLLIIHLIIIFLKIVVLQIFQEAIRVAIAQPPKNSINLIGKRFKEFYLGNYV